LKNDAVIRAGERYDEVVRATRSTDVGSLNARAELKRIRRVWIRSLDDGVGPIAELVEVRVAALAAGKDVVAATTANAIRRRCAVDAVGLFRAIEIKAAIDQRLVAQYRPVGKDEAIGVAWTVWIGQIEGLEMDGARRAEAQ